MTSGPERASARLPRLGVHPWWAGLTLALLGAIYWLSSADRGLIGDDQLPTAAWNLAHVPLFAVLAMCWVKTLAGNRDAAPAAIGAGFLAATLCAVLDEWHQSFVPGRDASWSDLALDVAGIGGVLVISYRRLAGGPRRRAQGSRQRAPRSTHQDVPSTLVHDR